MKNKWMQASSSGKLMAVAGLLVVGFCTCSAIGVVTYWLVGSYLLSQGGTIAYVKTTSRTGGEYDIYLSNPDGTNRQLTDLPGLETSPAWSFDGQKIAFTATQDSVQPNDCATGYVELKCNFEIYTINFDGTGLKRLTDSPAYDRDPAWSPDGQKVVFSSRAPGSTPGYIYIMNADGTGLTQLSQGGMVRDSMPSWSPDGQKIIFARETCCPAELAGIDIYVIEADGSLTNRLTTSKDSANPAWSPDGQSIAWLIYQDDFIKIGLMNADGSNQTVIPLSVSAAPGYRPAWSPDSQQILFVCRQANTLHLYRVNRDGTNLTQITNGDVFYSSPSWSPGTSRW